MMKLHKQVSVKIIPFRDLLHGGWWINEPHNPFYGLFWQEIGIVAIVGTAIAILAVVILITILSLFHISDASKYKVVFSLGIASLFIGYWVITRKRISPKSQTKNQQPLNLSPIPTEEYR
jgi:hypothetical protein